MISATDQNHLSRRTIKYLSAILSGIWIVNYQWIIECSKLNKWCNEEKFEVTGDALGTGGPKKGRLRAANNVRKILFYCILFD